MSPQCPCPCLSLGESGSPPVTSFQQLAASATAAKRSGRGEPMRKSRGALWWRRGSGTRRRAGHHQLRLQLSALQPHRAAAALSLSLSLPLPFLPLCSLSFSVLSASVVGCRRSVCLSPWFFGVIRRLQPLGIFGRCCGDQHQRLVVCPRTEHYHQHHYHHLQTGPSSFLDRGSCC